ncbi:MAG: PPE domain-containing protein [Mycobacteriaceae bacterium]
MNMPLTGVNWASRPTVKLVTDINDGPGPASSIEAGAAWRALSAVLSEADDDFTSATKLAMGSWEGPAADSARTALMPFSEWATVAGTIAHQLSAQTTAHGDAFSATKAGMPSLPEVLATEAVKDNIVDKTVGLLTGVPTPGEVAEVVAAEQQTQSALAMMSYDVTSSTLTTYTPFMPAPILTTEVVPTSAAANTVTYGHLGQHHAQDYSSTMSAGASGSASATNGGSVDGGHWAAAGGSGATHAAGSTASGAGSAGLGSGSGSVGTSFTGGSHSAAAGLGAGDSGAAGAGPTRTPSASGSFGGPGLAGAGLAGAGGAGRFGSWGGVGGSGASSGSVASAFETASRSSLSAGAHSSGGAAGDSSARGLGGASDSAATRGRGGVGSGMGTGAGLGNSDDDQEHEIPDYLKDLEHFSDGRVVAPPVIGVDDAL